MLMRALSVHIAHETSGAARIRHSLRPLSSRGRENDLQTSGATRRENAKLYPPSFRDAPLGAGPESITTIGRMDSGLVLRSPRNDDRKDAGGLPMRKKPAFPALTTIVYCPADWIGPPP
jgi:hypothetical protein